MLALAQARGGVAFSVVPFHCAYTYTQYDTCQALSFAGGICARRCRRDLQSLPGITSLGRNSWGGVAGSCCDENVTLRENCAVQANPGQRNMKKKGASCLAPLLLLLLRRK